jgi:hypothetical protein
MAPTKTWEKRAKKCKKKHRPKLSSWTKEGWAYSPRKDRFEALKEKFLAQPLSECPVDSHDTATLSVEDFVHQYEVPTKAVIIRNIPQHDQWPAHEKWNFGKFKCVKKRYFKVGEDDDGYSLKVSCLFQYHCIHSIELNNGAITVVIIIIIDITRCA